MTALRILETNLLFASDLLVWLDGTSATDPAQMQRINSTVSVQFDNTRPADLQWRHSEGKTALWRRASARIVPGQADEVDRQALPDTPYTLSGSVSDNPGRYNPRRFEILAGNAQGHSLVMYPTPLGTAIGRGGALRGNLRFAADGAPAVWAILTLTVNLGVAGNLQFRAQADRHGDFVVPMHRLPPLPQGVVNYAATLSVRALADAVADTPLDPADLIDMQLGRLNAAGFAAAIDLTVLPGQYALIRSQGRDHVAVQPI